MNAERLRNKALDYELSAKAQRDLGHPRAADVFAAVALVLYELAEAVEAELEEAA